MQTISHKSENGKVPALVTKPFSISPEARKIDLSAFLYVPQRKVYISIKPLDFKDGRRFNWEESHYLLGDKGLFMPSGGIFLTHYVNVRDAAHGRKTLYYANGKELKVGEAFDLWQYMNTSNERSGISRETFLDNVWETRVRKEDGRLEMVMKTNTRISKDAKLKQKTKAIIIPEGARDRTYAKLPVDDEGIPIEWISEDNCAPGLAIDFKNPQAGRVTKYSAGVKFGLIDCQTNSESGPLQLWYCAYSTEQMN